jgi:hypothetical protein
VNANATSASTSGQIAFGQTVSASGDTMIQYRNHALARPRKWVCMDIECDAGCGLVPFRYRDRSFVNALQWAIGLELFLLIEDPWRVFLTTDHPNGAPFTAYPHLIRLLMDRSFRESVLATIHRGAAEMSALPGLAREYSLREIAIVTRAGPARSLGLEDRGHLGVGAVADVTVYREQADRQAMFERPEYVFKDGRLVVKDGEVVEVVDGATHVARAPYDAGIEKAAPQAFRGLPHRAPRELRRRRRRDHGRRRTPHRARQREGGRVIVNGVRIEDTFAEAFAMKATRVLITAPSERWARIAADSMTGFATSVIACGCEAGIERVLSPARRRTAGRASRDALRRVDDGVAETDPEPRRPVRAHCDGHGLLLRHGGSGKLKLGNALRYFGDGFQISKRIGGRRYWRVPVMDGEFLCEDSVGMTKTAVGGGNFLVLAESYGAALAAIEAAVEAMRRLPNVILPFPGGIVRSGSKVGGNTRA